MRVKPILIRTCYRRLSDGESFFFTKLLEIRSWRSDSEIMGSGMFATYRDHLLAVEPHLYSRLLTDYTQSMSRAQLHLSDIYLELVQMISGSATVAVKEIIRSQLLQLERKQLPLDTNMSVFTLDGDQYKVYNRVTEVFQSSTRYQSGIRLFITGPAGTGKSFLLNMLVRWFKQRGFQYLLLAPTGIAANNIDGQTIHSALNIGGSSSFGSYKSSLFQSPNRMSELKKKQVIIIDEVSMVDCDLFTFISGLFARLHNNLSPFGNIHVVCLGDLMQLPPVSGRKVFHSPLWKLFHPLFLRESIRQQDDSTFFTLLNQLRFGQLSNESIQIIYQRVSEFSMRQQSYLTTFLVSYRRTAHQINSTLLQTLPDTNRFVSFSVDREEGRLIEVTDSSKTFKHGTNLPTCVECIPGAKVIYLNNAMRDHGIWNGTCGVIVELCESMYPTVAFPTAQGIQVYPAKVKYSAFLIVLLTE